MNPSLWFFSPRKWIYGVRVEVGGASGGPRGRGHAQGGRAPPPSWTGCGPPDADYFVNIFINSKTCLRGFLGHSENFYFCTKNNTMAVLLKTSSVWVSSIQIMQVRVQNKGKSVWQSRYDGDVSTPPSLNLWLSSRNLLDKLKEIKKNFYKLFLLLLL